MTWTAKEGDLCPVENIPALMSLFVNKKSMDGNK